MGANSKTNQANTFHVTFSLAPQTQYKISGTSFIKMGNKKCTQKILQRLYRVEGSLEPFSSINILTSGQE
jgi:hypothetical protein